MAIGRVSGSMLVSNLDRQGTDLQFTTNSQPLVYMNFSQFKLGVNTSVLSETLTINGNLSTSNVLINANTISAKTGNLSIGSPINIGAIGDVHITGGSANYVIATDGSGNLSFADVSTVAGSILGNTIQLGSNTAGALTSNAVTLTTTTSVTNSIAQLNQVLGKLVPTSPPTFPGSSTLSLSTSTSTGRITNFTQTDNSGWGNLSVAAGTSVSATRVSTYTAGTITSVGPGDSGTVTAYLNGTAAGNVVMAAGSQNGTYGNLVIALDQDYHNVSAAVTAGFWESFNASLSGSSIPAGWNRANINETAGNSTNTITWYYDSSTPGTPTFSNISIALYSNTVSYSSTIPHFTTAASFIIKGNVSRLSGDTYPVGVTSGASQMVTSTAGGAIAAPTGVSYTTAGVTVPLTRNLYVSSGSAYFETTAAVTTGFGSSASGPTVSVNNNYATGTSSALIVSGTPTILYKTGTTTNIEETSIPVNSVGTGSGNAYRILNPGSSDTPVYTGSEAAFNSQSSTLQTYDATNVGSGSQGVIKFDQTNYSTGYLPVGPNLSAQGANQYFTFKFVRTSVSKFDIKFTGTIAGLWVALPGSSIDTSSTLNGWMTMATAYAGSGYPGAGTGGNGSNGCALGGVATTGSLVTNGSYTCTFGTLSSSGTVTNEIYVRVKLTSGQSLTALTIEAPTH